ncbi:MAG: hypothetical protein AABX38_00120 [Candidatus Micrarchaeota archaeon]
MTKLIASLKQSWRQQSLLNKIITVLAFLAFLGITLNVPNLIPNPKIEIDISDNPKDNGIPVTLANTGNKNFDRVYTEYKFSCLERDYNVANSQINSKLTIGRETSTFLLNWSSDKISAGEIRNKSFYFSSALKPSCVSTNVTVFLEILVDNSSNCRYIIKETNGEVCSDCILEVNVSADNTNFLSNKTFPFHTTNHTEFINSQLNGTFEIGYKENKIKSAICFSGDGLNLSEYSSRGLVVVAWFTKEEWQKLNNVSS